MTEVVESWEAHYGEVKQTLKNVQQVQSVATAFNTNIDAVLKISGKKLAELASEIGLSWDELTNIEAYTLSSPQDVVKGAFRCFSKGIAEEWLANLETYDWMVRHLGFDRLQMGGQGGIVANALAVCGVQKIFNHCSSLPKQQAGLFLALPNLLSFDEKGEICQASEIDRKEDIPLIHWIIEFDRDDEFVLDGHKVKCPKSNRFIATYDPLNSHLVMDVNFVEYLNQEPVEAVVLSGYHPLTVDGDGVELIKGSVPVIHQWQDKGALLHLEVASTQDVIIRRTIIEEIARRADSIGLNEREAVDVLDVCGEKELAEQCEANPTPLNLFEAVLKIKRYTGCRRVQLHMFGVYITVQDKDFPVTPLQNRRGMCLAAVIAASKAGVGKLDLYENLLWSEGQSACSIGMTALQNIANFIGDTSLIKHGFAEYSDYDVIVVPTILIEKPLTLVGMGDTISSVSLIGALKA